MKAPAPLLLLALAVAVPASAATRCKDDQLKQIQGVLAQGGTPTNNKNIKSEPIEGGERPVFDVAGAPGICDKPVWRYLAVPDSAAVKPPAAPALKWSDDGLKAAWNGPGGLAEQTRILLAVNDLYGKADAAGKIIFANADAVLKAAQQIHVVTVKTGEGTGRLTKDGLTGEAYAALKGFVVSAAGQGAPPAKIVPAPGKPLDAAALARQAAANSLTLGVAIKPEDLKAALNLILNDDQPLKDGPVTVKLGPAVLEFRKSVIRLADLLATSAARRDVSTKLGVDAKVAADFLFRSSGPTWAASPADSNGRSVISDATAGDDAIYGAALKYLTDPAITAADDEFPREASALSRLDFGLRNMVAVNAAGVDAAVKATRESLKGQTVGAAIAAADRDALAAAEPAPKAGTLAADVLARLKGVQQYKDLGLAYDNAKTQGKLDEAAVIADQMKSMRADAAKTGLVTDAKGTHLDYGVGGGMATADGIVVAKLGDDQKNQAYRAWAAETIAENIASNPLGAKAQAAVDAILHPGAPVAKPLTPAELDAAKKLGPQPPAEVKPPLNPLDAAVTASPASGFFGRLGRLFGGKEDAAAYYSKANETIAATASDRSTQRIEIGAEAAAAEAAARRTADAERRRIADAPPDSDNPDYSAAKFNKLKAQALKAHDEAAALAVKAAGQAVLDKAKKDGRYVEYDSKAAVDDLNKKMDAAFSTGIAQAVGALHDDYKTPGSKRRLYAENKSGYKGKYYHLDRVDRYFHDYWDGDKQPPAVAMCKTSLGFSMTGGEGDFKNASVENVDVLCGPHGSPYCKTAECGVRDGLVLLLASYKQTDDTDAAPVK